MASPDAARVGCSVMIRPSPHSPTVMSAPASSNISSVWARVVTRSRTMVGPTAARPANRMADFTWALATLVVQSMPCSVPPLTTSGGRHCGPDPTTEAPINSRGSATRSMGRVLREASPIRTVSHGKPATMPASSRIEVPELPQSSVVCGWWRRLRPPRIVTLPPSVLSTPAPIASMAANDAATSAPSDKPWTTEVPSASAANKTARWEIDFSPGVCTAPLHGTPPCTTRIRGAVTTASRPGSGTPWTQWHRAGARTPPNRPPG